MGQAEWLKTKQVFWSVRQDALRKMEWLPHLKMEKCYLADEDHKKQNRRHAHVDHKPGVICVDKTFEFLPEANQRGILWHEVGHVANDHLDPEEQAELIEQLDEINDEEIEADYLAVEFFGVPLSYDENEVQILNADPVARQSSPG